MRLLLIVPALALAATAMAASAPVKKSEARLAKALDGRIAGKPQKCVPTSLVDGPDIIDSRTILYRQGAGRVWRNDLPDACPFLRTDRILVVELFGSEMCRNDLVSVIDRGGLSMPIGKCRLGDFTPYDKPKKAR